MILEGGSFANLKRSLIILIIIIILAILLIGLFGEVDRLIRFFWGVEEGVSYYGEDLSGYLDSEVRDFLLYYSKELMLYPVNAYIDKSNGEIIAEVEGEILDIGETMKKIFNAEDGEKVEGVRCVLKPWLTKKDIENISYKVGSYNTTIRGSEGRRRNIEIATKAINNILLLSGETFSFNRVVGPRTKEAGFAEAPEVVDGELTKGVGGGICQVSSTLYNALEVEGLEVVERHAHSKDVGYVPKGKDATVAWDYFDLKFKNNLSSPIIIKAKVVDDKLVVEVLGKEEDY
ncbi:VanW family protein [Halonatronum saccharophilum]|uniref:VanW family protein n=1 Tax=Halonatronum saccharophilum TaxID=150060 RepID=UPI000483098C|nr:VanW family protein [Halonatronum saccharophilum]